MSIQGLEQLLQAGQLQESLDLIQNKVRNDPANAEYRVCLFQILAVLGQWDRALNQLNVAAELNAQNLLMAQVCRTALACEVMRQSVFSGKHSPLIFGEPEPWLSYLMQANQLCAQQNYSAALEMRDQAFEMAPAASGQINGQPFAWLADADSLLGPVLEAVVDGKYYWIPFSRISSIITEIPVDLRDLLWLPSQFVWCNGGSAYGLINARYAGFDETSSYYNDDPLIMLNRKTEWIDCSHDLYRGCGQKALVTDAGEYPILEVRTIKFDNGQTDTTTGNNAVETKQNDFKINLSS